MKTTLTTLLAVAALAVAAPAHAKGMDGKRACVDVTSSGSETLISANMTASRTASYDGDNKAGGYDLLVLWIKLTTDGGLTRLDTTCTVSNDGNTTDYTPQFETVAAGTATQVNSGVWQKAISGSVNYPVRMSLEGFPDWQCVISVGGGAGDAGDTIEVRARMCTEGG